MIVREATSIDIPKLVELRMQLFTELGEIQSSTAAPELREATLHYFTDAIVTGQSMSWVAVSNGIVVASGTLATFYRPPYLGNLAGHEAYLLNIYTLPAYRRKLAATQILEQVVAYAKSVGFGKVWLHASPDGRAMYERFGFSQNPSEMEWMPS